MSDFEQCSNPLQPDLNYDFMRTGDFVECLNRLELYLITFLVNISWNVVNIMTRCDFQEARRVILSSVRTYFKNLK